MSNDIYQQVERYGRIILARKRVFVSVTLAMMTCGVVLGYLLPKRYEAASTVFIEQSVINELVKGIAVTPSMEAKIRVLSVSMLSRNMLNKVLDILDKDTEFATDADREAYLAELRERIAIRLEEKQGIFYISFTDSNPGYARDLVNTLTRVYIESNTASKRDESLEATRFLSEQIEVFKKRIDSVEEEINRYKAEHGLQLAVDETILRFEIADAEKKLEDLRARKVELETQARLVPVGTRTSGGLAEKRRQLAALRTTYTESHPKVIRLKGEIEAMRLNPPSGGGDGGSSKTRALIQAELAAAKGMGERLQRSIDEKMQLLREIPAIRTGLTELQRKKENENVIYNQLVTRYGQSEVSKQMEMENKAMTFRVVDPAVLPEQPVSPRRALIIAMSLVAGMAAGVLLILAPYKLGGAVQSVSDLRGLGPRVLAVIPSISKPEAEHRRKVSERRFLVLAAVYFCVLVAIAVFEALGYPYLENLIEPMLTRWLQTA